MNYRLYTPQDFAELYAIEEVCFQSPFRFGRRAMVRLIQSPRATTWIAEEDGRMAGFAMVESSGKSSGTIAYIQTIEVIPEQRGRGVGHQLLLRIEDSARAAGSVALWLHVDAQNAGAIRLYETHGYRCEGREEEFYAPGRAALIYRKLLETGTAG